MRLACVQSPLAEASCNAPLAEFATSSFRPVLSVPSVNFGARSGVPADLHCIGSTTSGRRAQCKYQEGHDMMLNLLLKLFPSLPGERQSWLGRFQGEAQCRPACTASVQYSAVRLTHQELYTCLTRPLHILMLMADWPCEEAFHEDGPCLNVLCDHRAQSTLTQMRHSLA